MTELPEQLLSLKASVERLLRSYTALKSENEMLRNQLEAQRRGLREKNEHIARLEEELSLVKAAKALGETGQTEELSKTAIRETINELIDEVDRCIALLNP